MNEDILRQAILARLPVRAFYDGLERFLCPHVLGRKGNRLHVLSYQYAGETSTGPVETPPVPADGPPDNWKCMRVADLDELALLPPGPWYTCARHTRRQTCVDRVLAEVGPPAAG